jgi:HSP20 family protein
MLTISTEKEENRDEKEDRFTRREYNFYSFSRSFTLPEDVRPDNIEAKYEDGLLKIVLPRKEEVKQTTATKQIAVQ